MNPIDQLKAVLCDPSGKCCIDGSDEDRAIIDRALQALTQPEQVTDYGEGFEEGYKAALAQPTLCYHVYKEHLAELDESNFKTHANIYFGASQDEGFVTLYTAPPKSEWVSLTSEELATIVVEHAGFPTRQAKAIEAALKDKNGANKIL